MCLSKVLRKEIDEDGRVTYRSPYINTMSWEESVRNSQQKGVDLEDGEIYEGAYHSFMFFYSAMDEAELLNKLITEIPKVEPGFPIVSYVIGEFTIPKDSKYVYEGEYRSVGATHTGYASSDLILRKIL